MLLNLCGTINCDHRRYVDSIRNRHLLPNAIALVAVSKGYEGSKTLQ